MTQKTAYVVQRWDAAAGCWLYMTPKSLWSRQADDAKQWSLVKYADKAAAPILGAIVEVMNR